MAGNRRRIAATSAVMSVVFMTTAACACRAKTGENGRARTDMTRSIGSGMCLIFPRLPLAARSRSAIWVKVREDIHTRLRARLIFIWRTRRNGGTPRCRGAAARAGLHAVGCSQAPWAAQAAGPG